MQSQFRGITGSPLRDTDQMASGTTISLDQHHWVGLAKEMKRPGKDPIYQRILELSTPLRTEGLVRFPLSADRYHETLRCPAHQRIDLACAMAALSGYETLVQLDVMTASEVASALCSFDPERTPLQLTPV